MTTSTAGSCQVRNSSCPICCSTRHSSLLSVPDGKNPATMCGLARRGTGTVVIPGIGVSLSFCLHLSGVTHLRLDPAEYSGHRHTGGHTYRGSPRALGWEGILLMVFDAWSASWHPCALPAPHGSERNHRAWVQMVRETRVL